MFETVRAEFALPETKVAEQAHRFAGQIEPAFVFAHSVRSYLRARAGWAGAFPALRRQAAVFSSIVGGSVTENRLGGQDQRAGKEVRSRRSYSLRSPAERVWR